MTNELLSDVKQLVLACNGSNLIVHEYSDMTDVGGPRTGEFILRLVITSPTIILLHSSLSFTSRPAFPLSVFLLLYPPLPLAARGNTRARKMAGVVKKGYLDVKTKGKIGSVSYS